MSLAIVVSLCAAIIVGAIAWRDRLLALSILLFCLPLYVVRFEILGIPFTFLEALLLVVVFVWLMKEGRQFRWNISRPMLLWMLMLVVASLVSLSVAPSLRVALGLWKAYLIEPMLLFLVAATTIKTMRDVRGIVWALGISAAIVSLIACVQYLTGWGIPEPWQTEAVRRATAFYGYPNAVGLFVAPITALLLGVVMHCRAAMFSSVSGRVQRIILSCIIVINVLGLAAARVDGGLIAVAAAGGVLLLYTRYRWVAVGVGALALLGAFLYEPTRQLLLFQDVSGDVRLALWKGTFALIGDRPLVGAGLAGFPTVYDLYRLPSHVELLLYPHNLLLDFWVELGALGAFWIVGTLGWWVMKTLRTLHASHRFSLALLGALVCIVVYGIVDVPYFKNDLAVLFWLWLALVYTLPHRA